MFTRLSNFYKYTRIVKVLQAELLERFDVRIDWIWRMWTVVNVPPEKMRNVINHGYPHLEDEVKRRIHDLGIYFIEKGLAEFVRPNLPVPLSEFSALVVVESRHVNSRRLFNTTIIMSILILVASIITGLVILL